MTLHPLTSLAIGAVLAVAWTTMSLADSEPPPQPLDAYLETVRSEYDLPALAAAVVEDGELVAAGAVGTRVHGQAIPVTIDDRFHIGSITKAMTATLAGMMVDEGKLRWDSTIGEVLGDDVEGMSPALAAVTLSQLLSHTGGIPGDSIMRRRYDNTDGFSHNLPELRLLALEAWKEREPRVWDDKPFRYANFGYITAGMMIESVTGQAWEQVIRERLFAPLGLSTAGFGPQATMGLYDAPVGHELDDGEAIPVPWGQAADNPPILGPAGTVHMSVLDLATWAAWNAGGGEREPAIVTPDTLNHIHAAKVDVPYSYTPAPERYYALGWAITDFVEAGRMQHLHSGSNGLNYALILVDLEADLGVVVATNLPGYRAGAAVQDAVKHLYQAYASP